MFASRALFEALGNSGVQVSKSKFQLLRLADDDNKHATYGQNSLHKAW